MKPTNTVFLTLFILSLGAPWHPVIRSTTAQPSKVTLTKTPDGGIQPQAVLDEKGTLHLVYFKGSPDAGDIFYVRKPPSTTAFSRPIRVNSVPGSVIAIGSVRGAQLAVGKNGIVHVAWLGSDKAEPRGPANSMPMVYTRSNQAGTTFEPQRNVLQFAVGLNGGGSVASDAFGHVYVTWHAGGPNGKGEESRRVWIARSNDNGATFSRETLAYQNPTGACGCCGMRMFADHQGNVYILYRAATESIHRDMFLLVSSDQGRTFEGKAVHPWASNMCPMSTNWISESPDGILIAWETAGQVYYTKVVPGTDRNSAIIAPPADPHDRKHPVAATNARGETLLAWTEGTGWKKGGALAWQVFDRPGHPTEERRRLPDAVPVWGLVSVVARPDGTFTIIY